MTTVYSLHYYVLLLPVTTRISIIYIEKAFFGLARSLRCMTFEKASVALLGEQGQSMPFKVYMFTLGSIFSFPKNWPNCMVDVW